MSNILIRTNREILQQFSWSNVLLAFDYDGTLAPIVADPRRAAMRATTRRLLRALTALYPVVVISGRAQADATRHLRGAEVDHVVGNHGAEPWHSSRRLSDVVGRWLPLLERRFASLRGVTIENKTYSVAVHYRHSREKRKARGAIVEAAAELGQVRIIGGKQVVNLLPSSAPHKGVALERERTRLRCDTSIYVGDDETDEDVFGLDQPGRLLGIRVGRSRTSAAPYYIPGQRAIDDLLRVLVELRSADEHRRVAR